MFFCLLNFFQLSMYAQDTVIDSLKLAFKNAKHDTTRCNILNLLIEGETDDKIWSVYNDQLLKLAEVNSKKSIGVLKTFYFKAYAAALNNLGFLCQQQGKEQEALEYYLKSLNMLEEVNDNKGVAISLNNIGVIYKNRGDISKAFEFYQKSLNIQEKIKDKMGIAYSLQNIGFLAQELGDISKALDYYHRSLKMREEIGDKMGLAASLTNIGSIYKGQGDIKSALDYYERAFKIREEIKDKFGMGQSLNNIAGIILKQGDITKALSYYQRSLKIREEIDNKSGIANSLINIGYIYNKQGDETKALEYYKRSFSIQEMIHDKEGMSNSLIKIGQISLKKGNVKEATNCALQSMKLAKSLGFPENVENAASLLKSIYVKQNKFNEALSMFELEILMRDSVANENTKKSSIKTQIKYEYEKQAAADSVKHAEEQKVKNAQLAAQSASLKQEKTQRYALYGGLLLVIAFSGFVFNRFRVTQKQKKVIEDQKVLVDTAYEHLHEKNKEVIDSITYARRIQRALLTSETYIDRTLNKLNRKS